MTWMHTDKVWPGTLDDAWQEYERLVESTKRCEVCGSLPGEPPGPECESDEGKLRRRESLWAQLRGWWRGLSGSSAPTR